jgi:hypothetical protein
MKNKFYVAVYVWWDSFEVMCVGQDEKTTLKEGKKIAKKMQLTGHQKNVHIYEAPLAKERRSNANI